MSFIATAVIFFIIGRYSSHLQSAVTRLIPASAKRENDYATLGDTGIVDSEQNPSQLYTPTEASAWGTQMRQRTRDEERQKAKEEESKKPAEEDEISEFLLRKK